MTPRILHWILLTGGGALALLAGIAGDDPLVAVVVALGLYAAGQAWSVRRFARLLRDKQRIEPPFPGGTWEDIYRSAEKLQRRNRARKRRVNRFLSRFLEAAAAFPDAVVILARDDRIEWSNPAADALLGLRGRGSVRMPIASFLRDPVFAEHLARRDSTRPIELPAPPDRRKVLSVFVTPFGRRRQRMLVARDVTRTFHLDQARKDFVANVSHELRTPLTVLAGNLEILAEDGADSDEPDESLLAMRANVERMQTLVEDLLALSRLEMDRGANATETVDVGALLRSILRDAGTLAAPGHHTLRLDAEPGLDLRGSTSQLRSAFSNLVHNAIRHTPPRTDIDIRWYADDQGAHLLVEDNGPGIPPRHIPRLTERFYRVDASRSSQTGGTGLGLAIVKHALERHGATLSVTSREGAGTTFGCHFPLSRTRMPGQDACAEPAESGPSTPGSEDKGEAGGG